MNPSSCSPTSSTRSPPTSRKFGTQDGALDFALLVDGLAAEREQKITIDVAYRFFATPRRKFIVIDAPGHEQYTANMATGASVADLALVLVSADDGLTRQSKRHVVILSMLGVRKLVLAVNKMDRVAWSQDAFDAIAERFRAFTAGLGFEDIVCIPLAANSGDNVVARSARTAGTAARRYSNISNRWTRRGAATTAASACRSNGSAGRTRIFAAIAA